MNNNREKCVSVGGRKLPRVKKIENQIPQRRTHVLNLFINNIKFAGN